MLKKYQISENKIVEKSDEHSPILLFINPDEMEKRFLIDELQVDEHTLNSSLDPDELSRLEFEPNHIALILKRPQNYMGKDNLLFRVSSSGIFLFKERIIIVMLEDIGLFEGKLFNKVISLPDVMLKLIYRAIFHFLEHLKIINMVSDELEVKINAAMGNKYLINLFTLEKSLVYYLNAINSNGVLIDKLKHNSAKVGFAQEENEFLDDIIIENSQCYRQAEIYSNILASLMDARASIVGNNLNVLMKTLNIITIGIMVPTFVVSAFSMNVGIPFQHHPYAFWMIMGLAIASVSSFMFFWKKKKW
jgi:magnesium transporter